MEELQIYKMKQNNTTMKIKKLLKNSPRENIPK
jgi:hypothetical protein